jgi:protein deglycase
MGKKVLVPIANGTEEVEALAIIDVLRRAGADVTVASVQTLQVTMAHDVKIVADCTIDECIKTIYDLIALPGGMPGAEYLRDSKSLIDLLKAQKEEGRWFAAICASPVIVLQHHGLLEGLNATCYPSMVSQLKNKAAAEFEVVVDSLCVTSQGPGTALKFAIKLVEVLFDKVKATQLVRGMLVS